MLGKGLESLIPNKSGEQATPPAPQSENNQAVNQRHQRAEAVFQIEVDKIKPNPLQPRKEFDEAALQELAASIREMGIIQPLIVTKVEKETPQGTEVEYQLVAGERRLRAAKLVGLERVPAIIRNIGQEKDKLEMAIVENVQRTDLNPVEAARSYARLQEEFGLTQREIAARVGKSRETITNLMRLLNLPTQVQEALAKGQLSESQGRVLLTINDPNQQLYLFEQIVNNNLSVRELKLKIARLNRPVTARLVNVGQAEVIQDPQVLALAEKLEEMFGTKVAIQRQGEAGKLIINFYSQDELDSLMEKLERLGGGTE